MKKLKKANLIDMDIRNVALVDKGANKRTFFLFKSENGGLNMTIKTAKKLIKSKALSNEEKEEMIQSFEGEQNDELSQALELHKSEQEKSVKVNKKGSTFSKVSREKIERALLMMNNALDVLQGMMDLQGEPEKAEHEDDEEEEQDDVEDQEDEDEEKNYDKKETKKSDDSNSESDEGSEDKKEKDSEGSTNDSKESDSKDSGSDNSSDSSEGDSNESSEESSEDKAVEKALLAQGFTKEEIEEAQNEE